MNETREKLAWPDVRGHLHGHTVERLEPDELHWFEISMPPLRICLPPGVDLRDQRARDLLHERVGAATELFDKWLRKTIDQQLPEPRNEGGE